MSASFFSELKDFLPVFVSPRPSYIHASIAFIITILVGHMLTKTDLLTLDIDGDGVESEKEKKMKNLVYYGSSAIVGFFIADTVFGLSWKLRNKVNRPHLTYANWFPGIYGV